jgi:hypothetical protein
VQSANLCDRAANILIQNSTELLAECAIVNNKGTGIRLAARQAEKHHEDNCRGCICITRGSGRFTAGASLVPRIYKVFQLANRRFVVIA